MEESGNNVLSSIQRRLETEFVIGVRYRLIVIEIKRIIRVDIPPMIVYKIRLCISWMAF